MSADLIPRNTWSKTVRLFRIDDLIASGLNLTADAGVVADPNSRCGFCSDRLGMHVLVLSGDEPDEVLVERLEIDPILGTIENYERKSLPFACATFGVLPE